MNTSMHERTDGANFLVAAFAERDRRLRLVTIVAGTAVVAIIIVLTVGTIRAGLAASRERAAADQARAVADSLSGLLTQVEWYHQRTLAADEKTLGTKHPDVAKDLNGLAALYVATGRYLEAEQLMRRALAIDRQRLGDKHPKVAGDMLGLAELYGKMGRAADAEPLYRQAREISASRTGKNPGN